MADAGVGGGDSASLGLWTMYWPGHWHAQGGRSRHQRDEPQFPRPHGGQGIAGVSGVAGHRGQARVHVDRRAAHVGISTWLGILAGLVAKVVIAFIIRKISGAIMRRWRDINSSKWFSSLWISWNLK